MLQLIPAINGEYVSGEGTFALPDLVIMAPEFPAVNKVFEQRVSRLKDYKVEAGKEPVIALIKEKLGEEAYRLEIMPEKVTVYAEGETGYSNALASLYQLLANGKGTVSCCSFSDTPKYGKRGLMLDACRHFFSVEEIKKILEQCALLKLNHFHWHLSEDQGFRIESKKFPQLNQISSYRKLNEKDPLVEKGIDTAGKRYGGFYTQEEIKDLVGFAADRQIEIIPEIDLPGHTVAILAAFPEYSCSGEALEVANTFGVFERVFCAGKEESYHFLYELLDEVCGLFPSKFIHIGGDEVPKSEWHICEKCNHVMKEKNFSNYEQLQAYFTGKIIGHLKGKGKVPIVWNEAAASGELDENAIIQYWMEMAPGASYVVPEFSKGRKLILSSMNQLYCSSYADVPLKTMLLYEPEVKGTPVPAENVLGIEMALWTEWTPENEDIERMLYPRLHSLAESAWTRERHYDSFIERLKGYLQVEALNQLKGTPWEEATIHGPAALDMIVRGMLEMGERYGRMEKEGGGKAEAVIPDGVEKIDPADMTKLFIYDKMKAAYSEEEIMQVQDRLLKAMMNRKER